MEHYTVSLGFLPNSASVHANRAASYLKLHMWAEAVADCDAALALDPGHVKVWCGALRHVNAWGARYQRVMSTPPTGMHMSACARSCVGACVCVRIWATV